MKLEDGAALAFFRYMASSLQESGNVFDRCLVGLSPGGLQTATGNERAGLQHPCIELQGTCCHEVSIPCNRALFDFLGAWPLGGAAGLGRPIFL